MPALESTLRKKRYTKQTFEVRDRGKTVYMHTLLVNPQEMSVSEPNRASVQQTLGGAYISHFGQGLHEVTISGTTGYNARYNSDGVLTDGFEEMKNFRNKVYRDFIKGESSQLEMFWYNWEDEEYYKVHPMNFRLMRNAAEPLLYRYELHLTALEPVGAGKKPKLDNYDLNEKNVVEINESTGLAVSGFSEAFEAFQMGTITNVRRPARRAGASS